MDSLFLWLFIDNIYSHNQWYFGYKYEAKTTFLQFGRRYFQKFLLMLYTSNPMILK